MSMSDLIHDIILFVTDCLQRRAVNALSRRSCDEKRHSACNETSDSRFGIKTRWRKRQETSRKLITDHVLNISQVETTNGTSGSDDMLLGNATLGNEIMMQMSVDLMTIQFLDVVMLMSLFLLKKCIQKKTTRKIDGQGVKPDISELELGTSIIELVSL